MNCVKIGKWEAISLIVIIVLNHIVLNMPKSLIDKCGPSTPLNLIFVILLVFVFLAIILKLWKPFGSSDILDISEFLGGNILKMVIGFLFMVHFLTLSSTLLRNFSEILKVVYLEKSSVSLIILFFVIVSVIANCFGPKNVMKCNFIITPIILLNLLIAFFCIFSRFELKRVFPIFGYGINETFFSGMSNIFAFTGLSVLYFIKPLLKEPKDFNKIGYIAISISAFYLLLSVATLLFSFADVLTINELSSVYLLIRGTDFGRFLQRPDALFILGWILSLMSYLSIIIFMVSHIFQKITNTKDTKPMIYCFATISFIIALLPKNMAQIRWLENTFFRYSTIILVFIVSFLVLLFAYYKHKKIKEAPND